MHATVYGSNLKGQGSFKGSGCDSGDWRNKLKYFTTTYLSAEVVKLSTPGMR